MKPTDLKTLPDELKDSKLSVLMPLYNERDIIVQNVAVVLQSLHDMGIEHEIVLADDGSSDDGYELLVQAYGENPCVKIVRNHQNFGKGWVLKTAYEFSTGDYVLFLDSDLELSIWHLPNFFRLMIEKNADVVIGSKNHPDSVLNYPAWRKFLSLSYYTLIKIFFGLPIQDSQTGIKLFSRAALERAIPRMLVKKFAFDIELLLIIHKAGYHIEPAPVELHFSREGAGHIHFHSVYLMAMDTLAIFYRDRILRFYNRPFGENRFYSYHLFLFQKNGDDFEKENLNKFLNIHYEKMNITVLGGYKWDVSRPNLNYFCTKSLSYVDRLREYLDENSVSEDYVLFCSLDAYADQRILLPAGRLLNQEGVGAIGGFLSVRPEAPEFEKIASRVLASHFINLHLSYRYRPATYRQVKELPLDGMIVRADLLSVESLQDYTSFLLEYALSHIVIENGLNLYYTPDLFVYKTFPSSGLELHAYLKKRALQRMLHLSGKSRLSDWKFLIGIVYLLIVAGSVVVSVVFHDWRLLLPLLLSYAGMLIKNLFFVPPKVGLRVFGWLFVLQFVYGFSLIQALFVRKQKNGE